MQALVYYYWLRLLRPVASESSLKMSVPLQFVVGYDQMRDYLDRGNLDELPSLLFP